MLCHRLDVNQALVVPACAFEAGASFARGPHARNVCIDAHVTQATHIVVRLLSRCQISVLHDMHDSRTLRFDDPTTAFMGATVAYIFLSFKQ